MLDDLLIALLDELALEGSKGATLQRIWSMVNSIIAEKAAKLSLEYTSSALTPLVDEAYQRFLWPFIVTCEGMEFVESTPNGTSAMRTMEEEEYESYDVASSLQTIRLVAATPLRLQALYGSMQPEFNITENMDAVMNIIAFSRQNGVTQTDLAIELDMDARALFSITKKLVEQNLIIKKPAVSKGNYTALCILKRFDEPKSDTPNIEVTKVEDSIDIDSCKISSKSDEENQPESISYRSDVVRSMVLQLLQKAKSNIMPLQDISVALGFDSENPKPYRWLSRFLDRLSKEKGFQKVKVPRRPGTNATTVAIRLVKSDESGIEQVDVSNPNILVMGCSDHIGQIEDVPFQYVVHQHVINSGSKGITSTELRALMPYIPSSHLYTTLVCISKPPPPHLMSYSCLRVKEMVGKEHRLRYYSSKSWHELKTSQGKAMQEFEHNAELNEDPDLVLVSKEVNPFADRKNDARKLAKRRKVESYAEGSDQSTDSSDIPLKRQKRTKGKTVAASTKAKPTSSSRKLQPQGSLPQDDAGIKDNAVMEITQKQSIAGTKASEQPTVTLPVVKSTTKKTTKSTSKAPEVQNATTTRRMEIMLKILEAHKVCEINNVLMDEFSELDSAGQEVRHKVDRRTLNKLAERLEKEKMARIIKCSVPLLNGSIVPKTLLLHESVTASDDVVKKYIEGLRDQNAISRRSSSWSRYEVVNLPVENPVVDSAESAESRDQSTDTRSKPDDIKPAKIDAPVLSHSRLWRAAAMHYGWITARLLRIKLIHRHMLQLAMQTPQDNDDRPTFTVTTAHVITKMPLKTFLMAVGVRERISLLDSYLLTEDSSKTTMSDLPDQLRSEIFKSSSAYRRLLSQCIEVLCALELVGPMNDGDVPRLRSRCELLKDVPLRNYLAPGYPILHHVSIRTLEELDQYWDQLQYISTSKALRKGVQGIDNASSQGADSTPEIPKKLEGLTAMSCWYTKFTLDNYAREILERHVNRETRTTPFNDHRLCIKIANQCGISVQVVREFFKSIESGNDMKKRERKRITVRPQATDARSIAINSILLDPAVRDQSSSKPHVMTTGLRKTKKPKNSMRQLKVPEKVFDGEDSVNLKTLSKFEKSYLTWSPEELELLIYSYSILRHRSRFGRFLWEPMKQVFPNRTPETCRHMMSKILRKTDKKESIDKLIKRWDSIYHHALEAGTIVDNDMLDNLNFNLRELLEVFLKELQKDTRENLAIDLPANVEALYALLESKNIMMKPVETKNLADFADAIISIDDRRRMLLKASLKLFDEIKDVSEDQPETHSSQAIKIRQYILMILMTPNHLYDPILSYRVINTFPSPLVDQTIQQLHEDGLIIKTKPSAVRNIPGRGFGVSEKFLHTLTAYLSDFEKARAFSNELVVPSTISPFISNSDMMVVLDALASGRMKLDIDDADNVIGSFYSKRRSIMRYGRVGFDVVIGKYSKPTQPSQVINHEEKAMQLQALPVNDQNERAQELAERFNNPLVVKICSLLNKAKEVGLRILDLKSQVSAEGITEVDQKIREALDIIMSENPPLAYVGGCDMPVIVSTAFPNGFAIECKLDNTNRKGSPLLKKQKKQKTIDKFCGDLLVKPRLWADIHGNKINVVQRGCAQAILNLIVRRPGITEAAIHQKFTLILGLCEIQELLAYLESLTAISSRCLLKPQPVHLFSVTSVYRNTDHISIESQKVKCYFPRSGYYAKVT